VLVVGLTFLVVLALVVVPYWLFVVKPEETAQATLLQRLRAGMRPKLTKLVLAAEEQTKAFPRLDLAIQRAGKPGRRLREAVEQSGLPLTAAHLLLLCIFTALLVGSIVLVLVREWRIAAVVAAVGSMLPYVFVRRKATVRMRRFEEQFPEAIDLIARALRAGHAFPTGLAMVSEEIPRPVGTEFKLLYDRQNYGMSLPDSLRLFAARIPVLEARFFVTAVLTQREVGGNLSEVLDNLAAVMRERFKVKRQIRVISAHGRITGWVLAAMPPVLACALFIISPNHMHILINDPLGPQMIITAIALQVMGTLIIRRIVNVEY